MKKAIIIMGMHRSGTSAIAGILDKLGCYSGENENLYQADSNNTTGYFERRDVVSCNENILSRHFNTKFAGDTALNQFRNKQSLDGFGWLFGTWATEFQNIANNETRQQIKDTLDVISSSSKKTDSAYVIKDPRLSLTYPYWESLFDEKSLVIIMLRNPLDVAKSLNKRNSIPNEVAMDIWGSYTKSAFENTDSHQRIVISYDDLIEKTTVVVDNIITFLKKNDLNINRKSIVQTHIKDELRHSKTSKSNKSSNPNVLQYYKLINNDYSSISELKDISNIESSGWKKILFVPTISARIAEYENTIMGIKLNVSRILMHPIVGPIIKFVRWIKRDKTFAKVF